MSATLSDAERTDRRVRAYMEKLQPAVSGQNGHTVLLRAAAVLVYGFGLSPDQAWPFALEYNARCMPPWSERELRRKLNEALRKPDERPRGHLVGEEYSPGEEKRILRREPGPKPVFEPAKLSRLAAEIDEPVGAAYLGARSKFTCWNRSPAGVLHKLYREGEKIVIFTVFKSQGAKSGNIRERPETWKTWII